MLLSSLSITEAQIKGAIDRSAIYTHHYVMVLTYNTN